MTEPQQTDIVSDMAIRAALAHAKQLNAETETVFTDNQGTWFGARLDNHPTTAAFEMCGTCLQLDGHEDECPEGYHPLNENDYCVHGGVVGSNECLLCGPVAAVPPVTPPDAAMRAAEERDLLAWGIANAATRAGIIDGSLPLIGPQLLMLCDDLATAAQRTPEEREFVDASIAVWREIDRLSALPGGYKGLPPETDPRKRELAAWERYRTVLDTPAATTSPETPVGGEE